VIQDQQEQIKKLIFAKDEKEDKKTNKKQNAFDITDPDGRLEKERAS
jgi:hypothetical protein